jgi:hypothetical protein
MRDYLFHALLNLHVSHPDARDQLPWEAIPDEELALLGFLHVG